MRKQCNRGRDEEAVVTEDDDGEAVQQDEMKKQCNRGRDEEAVEQRVR